MTEESTVEEQNLTTNTPSYFRSAVIVWLLVGVVLAIVGLVYFDRAEWPSRVTAIGGICFLLIGIILLVLHRFAPNWYEKNALRWANWQRKPAVNTLVNLLSVVVALFVLGSFVISTSCKLAQPSGRLFPFLFLIGVLVLAWVIAFLFQVAVETDSNTPENSSKWDNNNPADSSKIKKSVLQNFAEQTVIFGVIFVLSSLTFQALHPSNSTNQSNISCVQGLLMITLGGDTLFLGLLATFVGFVLGFWQKEVEKRRQQQKEAMERSRKKDEEQWQNRLDSIQQKLDSESDWLSGVRTLLAVSDDLPTQFEGNYKSRMDQIVQNWDEKFLSWIEKSVRDERDALTLEAVETVREFLKTEKERSDIESALIELWDPLLSQYKDRAKNLSSETIDDFEPVFRFWEKYDYLAYGTCALAILRLIEIHGNTEENQRNLAEQLRGMLTEKRARLWRCPWLEPYKDMVDSSLLTYPWPYSWRDARYHDHQDQITKWLQAWDPGWDPGGGPEQLKATPIHPFGPIKAEWAGSELSHQYVPPDIESALLCSEPVWIQGNDGSGRTALSMHLYNKISAQDFVFPILVRLSADDMWGKKTWLEKWGDAVANGWIKILSRKPGALLDYFYEEEQTNVTMLLRWRIGAFPVIMSFLARDRETRMDSSPEHTALRFQLQSLVNKISLPSPLPYALSEKLVSTRPAGTSKTRIILDMDGDTSEMQEKMLGDLVVQLQELSVYPTILSHKHAPSWWYSVGHSYALTWNSRQIKDMLEQREVGRLFDDWHDDRHLALFLAYAQDERCDEYLPKRMVELGNEVLGIPQHLEIDQSFTLEDLQEAKANLENRRR